MKRNTWYVRWFFWSCLALDRFTKRRRFESRVFRAESNGTNLCQFFRISLSGVLLLCAVIAWYIALLSIIFVLPFIMFSASNILFTVLFVGCVIIALCAFVGGMVLLFFLADALQKYLSQPSDSNHEDADPGVLTLVRQYVHAVSERYCPIIKFRGES